MRYMSIDIETTGLDPEVDQIIEVGAVVDDLTNPRSLADLARLTFFVKHDRLNFQPGALSIHLRSQILQEWTAQVERDKPMVAPLDIKEQLRLLWMNEIGKSSTPIIAAGKNFATFDRLFLMKQGCKFGHRTLDPTMFSLRVDDSRPPNTEECLHRNDLQWSNTHRSLDDALDVVRLMRKGLNLPCI